MTVNKDNAHRIIFTSGYEEKQQALIDTMLCTWSDVSTWNGVYSALDKLTESQQLDVAQAIVDRRTDKQKGLL